MKRVLSFFFLATSSSAWAHPGHGSSGSGGLEAGLWHPISGLDHLLMMVAIGLWASQQRGQFVLAIPAMLLVGMLWGGLLALLGVHLPMVEPGILVSILVIGILLVTALQVPLLGALALTACIAMLYGFAHGSEMPISASGLLYFSGILASTAGLTAMGFWIGRCLPKASSASFARIAGCLLILASLTLVAMQ